MFSTWLRPSLSQPSPSYSCSIVQAKPSPSALLQEVPTLPARAVFLQNRLEKAIIGMMGHSKAEKKSRAKMTKADIKQEKPLCYILLCILITNTELIFMPHANSDSEGICTMAENLMKFMTDLDVTNG